MGKVLIFEGINKTGKSETIKYLLDKGYKYIPFYDREIRHKYHNTTHSQAALDAQLSTIIKFLEVTNDDYIFDRLHFSEYVYGWVDRGYDNLTTILEYDRRLADIGAKLVLMTDSVENIFNRMSGGIWPVETTSEKHQQMYNRIEDLMIAYDRVYNLSRLEATSLNYGKIMNDKKYAENLFNFINN